MSALPALQPNPRLIVIDDDAAVRQVVASVGRSAGFDVAGCDGDSDLDVCLRQPADLIILDLVMPVVDGVEIIERLATTHSAARLVLVSGQDRRVLASASRLATAHGLKVAAVFAKPFNGTELRDCLAEQRGALSAGDVDNVRDDVPDVRASRIEQALRNQELLLHYQPQVCVTTLEWLGVEALARWEHPDFGLVSPGTFIPVVDGHPALQRRFTDFVIRTACHEIAPAASISNFKGRVALNVSADVLAQADFPDRLVTMCTAVGLERERIVLEVTETTLPAEPMKVLAIQTRLRMRGISLAVDDFGTGHSSLERLHTFPMDELKIDLQFVRESTTDPEARAIVQNSIALARDLQVRCVAEGVEDVEALKLLRELRCGCAQGYFIGRPMPAGELSRWAADWERRRVELLPQLR